MITSDQIITRLRQTVPVLGEIAGAIELAALLDSKPQPRPKPMAHVVPMGLRGGAADAASGVFRQQVDVMFAVFVTIASVNDPKGARAISTVDGLLADIIDALAGWGPADAPGVLRLVRSAPQQFAPGALVYAVEFAIQDQLRITQ